MVTSFLALLLGATLSAAECDRLPSHGTSVSISNEPHDSRNVFSYSRSSADRCETATIVGVLTYSADEDDVVAMPFGSSAIFREHSGSLDRELGMSTDADGRIVRAYRDNGHAAEFDAGARAWLSTFLPRLLKSAGINVGPRVARWRSQGGVPNALQQIEALESSGSMRKHYEALIDGRLSDDDLDRTLNSVSAHMHTSSGDLRLVLTRLAPANTMSARTLGAFQTALVAMPSSGDKAATIEAYGSTTNREVLRTLMGAAPSIQSSGDRSRVLRHLAPRYLKGNDADLRKLWFSVAEEIPSSGDLRGVLMTAMPYADDVTVARSIITTSRAVTSSGDRSSVLVSLAKSSALADRETLDAFITAAREIPSDGDRARALRSVPATRD